MSHLEKLRAESWTSMYDGAGDYVRDEAFRPVVVNLEDAEEILDDLVHKTYRPLLEAKDQEIPTRQPDLSLREVMQVIKADYPSLPPKFWEDASRRLAEGVPSYVIEREARGQTPNETKPKPEGAGAPFVQQGGGGERVTRDNIDKLHLEGKLPGGDEAYRKFLQTGQI